MAPSLAEDKEERLILRNPSGRRGRRGIGEKVKWLGVILYDELDFGPDWDHTISKAKNLLGALDSVGKSKWGMSPLSWRQAYTSILCSVASWGIRWVGGARVRGERRWRSSSIRHCGSVLER